MRTQKKFVAILVGSFLMACIVVLSFTVSAIAQSSGEDADRADRAQVNRELHSKASPTEALLRQHTSFRNQLKAIERRLREMGIAVTDSTDTRTPRDSSDAVTIEKERAMAARAASRTGVGHRQQISIGYPIRNVGTIVRMVKRGTKVETGEILIELDADGTTDRSIRSPVTGVVHYNPKLRVGTKLNKGQAILSVTTAHTE